jgi:hypothetical protein
MLTLRGIARITNERGSELGLGIASNSGIHIGAMLGYGLALRRLFACRGAKHLICVTHTYLVGIHVNITMDECFWCGIPRWQYEFATQS